MWIANEVDDRDAHAVRKEDWMNMSVDAKDRAEESEKAGRLPSLEEQTPGLDTEQDARTLRDAEAYYAIAGESDDPPIPAAKPDKKEPLRGLQSPR